MSRCRWTRKPIWLIGLLAAGCSVPHDPEPSRAAANPAPGSSHATAARGDDREHLSDLPQLPASPLAGQDADRDHIRDDIAAYIDTRYDAHERTRLAARQFARAEQHGLVYARDPDKARDAGDEIARAIECLYALLPADDADASWKELQARTFDNEERLDAYFALEQALSGGYFESAPERAQSCAFDQEGLAP